MRTSMRTPVPPDERVPEYSSNGYDSEKGQNGTLTKRRLSRKDAGYEQEDPFAAEEDDPNGTKYRSMEWYEACAIMIAETISLGILSLPSVIAEIGLVGGILLILGLGIIATYTGYVIGQFKMAYPYVHSMAEAGEILFKPLGCPRFGKEFLGSAQVIFLIFSMSSHILTWIICLDTITNHATCSIAFGVVALALFWICDLPRTLKKTSWLSIISFVSIFSAVMITMIGLGVDPQGKGTVATTKVPFADAFLSVTNIIFAYAGHVAFFSFISELKNPKDFPKALYVLQVADTTFYVIAAIVIYRYAGNNVASPALGSAAPIIEKVAYGIAIPTIVVAGVIYGHVATKYVFVRLFRGTKTLSARTWYSYGVWAGIALLFWTIAWIIAESIPVFNNLLALISALFASWFTYGLSGIFWLFLNYGHYTESSKKIFLTVVNTFLVLMGGVICGAGLYASGLAIKNDPGSGSWSCGIPE